LSARKPRKGLRTIREWGEEFAEPPPVANRKRGEIAEPPPLTGPGANMKSIKWLAGPYYSCRLEMTVVVKKKVPWRNKFVSHKAGSCRAIRDTPSFFIPVASHVCVALKSTAIFMPSGLQLATMTKIPVMSLE
jgi:hypothetical protein